MIPIFIYVLEYIYVFMRIYISHSVGCAQWNMPALYAGTHFANACRTGRYREPDRGIVKILDWDYRAFLKTPEKIKTRHLEIVKEDKGIETIMSIDLWDHNVDECLEYTDELLKHANRVLIPVHHYTKELIDGGYQLAYPNANWFAGNVFPPGEYRDLITHVLGGAPNVQYDLVNTNQVDIFGKPLRFKNVESVDGNQIFNVAIRAGKVWYYEKPHWRKPREVISNQEIFIKSLQNMEKLWHGEKNENERDI